MKQLRLTARHLCLGFAVGILLVFSIYRNPVQAIQGTATFTGTSSELTGDITAGRLVDQANSAYFIDPAASGNSLVTAGTASVSGNLVLNAAATIQTTNMQPLTIGSATTGITTVTSGDKLQLQAGGTGTGSTGTANIFFLNSSGTTIGRFDTTTLSATGGTITTSGGYTIHTFTSSGTFAPNGIGDVEYLVVGGGGSGGRGTNAGGGGGAGGFRTGTGFSVTAQSYTITVGAGGNAQSTDNTNGNAGSDSIFSTITASGGAGGGQQASNGGAGASGGGGGHQASGGAGNTPSTSPSQGSNGGNGLQNAAEAGGGGGGASAIGGNATGTSGNLTGGVGGAGTASSISGSSVTYAGGGGGSGDPPLGAGGAGGGGNGRGSVSAATAGTANTGGGGGGGRGGASGAGGSGIVIVRYLTGSLTSYGTLYLGSTNTSSADLAEYYVSGDKTIEAGDVVIISQKSKVKSQSGEDVNNKGVLMKAKAPYDRNLIGIISTNPGVLMGSIDGENKEDKRMLALSGRAPVKIDPDSEPIDVGDFLTSSDKPGLAMKATKAGYTVGKALENWTPLRQGFGGASRIDAFIQLTYYMGDIDPWGNFKALEVDTLKVNKTLEVGGVNVLDEINNLKKRLEVLENKQ